MMSCFLHRTFFLYGNQARNKRANKMERKFEMSNIQDGNIPNIKDRIAFSNTVGSGVFRYCKFTLI